VTLNNSDESPPIVTNRAAAVQEGEEDDDDDDDDDVVVVAGVSRTRLGMRLPLFLSQKSIPPAKLPYPAHTMNRPWGEISMVLRDALPNKKVGSPEVPWCNEARGGMHPEITPKGTGPTIWGLGIQLAHRMGGGGEEDAEDDDPDAARSGNVTAMAAPYPGRLASLSNSKNRCDDP
jgi:hypothetical protein